MRISIPRASVYGSSRQFFVLVFGVVLDVLSERACVPLELDFPFDKQILYLAVPKHRPILAHKERSELAVPAQADGAFHISLHGHANMLVIDSTLMQLQRRKAHHNFRTADEGNGICRVERSSRYQCGHDADIPLPAAHGAVDRDVNVEVEPGPPLLEFLAKKHIHRRAVSLEQNHFTV
jgi:hypothetical protein